MIAAESSGSGKTTVTRALMLALKKAGCTVMPFKCGPDYIDPMYHKRITGIPGHNLDTFFTDKETTRQIFARDCLDVPEGTPVRNRIAVVEGVMGLYDGVTGFLPEGSSYDLADALQMPIILCVNARGAAETLLAMISGILDFDNRHLIRGIFLNRVSDGFFPALSKKIEDYTGVPVVGHLPSDSDIEVKSRHLGLYLPGEKDSDETDGKLYQMISERCNIYRLLNLTEMHDIDYVPQRKKLKPLVDIAIARDDAFNFFYRENEIVLEEAGARLVPFSPLCDEKIPETAGGLILPGGYPERFTKELSGNTSMLSSIRNAIKNGMPVLAECGGFMYLHDSIDGTGPLVGVLSGDCFYTGKSVRFGYLKAYDKAHSFVREESEIRGHEFHYYDVNDPGSDAVAIKPVRGTKREAGFSDDKNFLSFMHFYYPSCPGFAAHFVFESSEFRVQSSEL